MLVSAVLDFGTAEFGGGNDDPYALYLPTYAAVAHYHGKHGDRPLRDVLAEAEAYAERDYLWVLARGSRLTADERAAAAARVAELSGLSADYVDRVNLRPEHIRFLTELLRDRPLVVGRIDGRFTGWDSDYGRETWSSDPSINAIIGPYTAALNHYVRAELGYSNDLPYEVLTDRVQPGRTPSSRTSTCTYWRRWPPRCGPTRTCACTWTAVITTSRRRTSPPSTRLPTWPFPLSWPRTSTSVTTRLAT